MAVKESYAGKINRKLTKKLRVIAVAAGHEKADLVLKNATYVNVFSNELCHGDIAVAEGLIVGMGEYSGNTEVDMGGKIVLPGFVDAHIHLESSLVSPTEFAKAVLPHGTTTVITDPHEIANVMGTDGIEYMLQATEDLPVDVRFMLPSCVPATPLDESGANLDYRAIDSFYDYPRVQGLAEMMNFVGTINGDPQVVEKIVASQAHHKKIDGHAPDLVGNDLNAYIAAGVYSDHECSTVEDARSRMEARGFTCKVVGSGGTVTDQTPAGGAVIPGKATIILYAGAEKPNTMYTVPQLVGKTAAEANVSATNAGLLVRFSGATQTTSGNIRVLSQSLEAGQQVPAGTVITVQLGDTNMTD